MQIFAFDLNVYIHIRSILGGNFYIDYRNEIIVIHVIGMFDFVLTYLRLDDNELYPKLVYNRKVHNDGGFFFGFFFFKQFN